MWRIYSFIKHLVLWIEIPLVRRLPLLWFLGTCQLYWEHAQLATSMFLSRLWCIFIPVRLIALSVQCLQLESGNGTPILEKPGTAISYLTTTWITAVRRYLNIHNHQGTHICDKHRILSFFHTELFVRKMYSVLHGDYSFFLILFYFILSLLHSCMHTTNMFWQWWIL